MKKGKNILGVLLAGVFLITSASPVYASSISERQKKAKELEKKKNAAEAQEASLSSQLNKIIKDMKKAEEDLLKKEEEIAVAEDELTAARIKEETQYENMKTRIKYMYENGNTKFIQILVASENMADFINKAEYINQISTADREMLDEYQRIVKEVEEKEAKLKKEKQELLKLQDNLEAQQKKVNTLLADKQKEISSLESEIGENAKELNRLIAQAKDAERRRKEQAAASSGSSGGSPGQSVVSGNGQLSNPCPAARISSEYGPRVAPTAGASTFHRGRDYAAGAGTPIYASDEGTVVTVSYNSVRGNYVVISHGNGLQTWYQHCTSVFVSQGQKVSRGQNIATVGSTGIVTGAHLHYEVHVNGTPVDPRSYL